MLKGNLRLMTHIDHKVEVLEEEKEEIETKENLDNEKQNENKNEKKLN